MPIVSEFQRMEVLRSYSKEKGWVAHQIESYNTLLRTGLQQIIEEEPRIDVYDETQNKSYHVHFRQLHVGGPKIVEESRIIRTITPNEARTRNQTYDAPISLDITTELRRNGILVEKKDLMMYVIGRIPLMIGCSHCPTSKMTEAEKVAIGECPGDPGGHFIVKGTERVIIMQERAAYNNMLVIKEKAQSKYLWRAEVRTISLTTGHSVLLQVVIDKSNKNLCFSLPYISTPIPIGCVFVAMGIEPSDFSEIIGINHVAGKKYVKLIHEEWQSMNLDGKDAALTYIGSKSMHIVHPSRRRDYALQILENETTPNLGVISHANARALFIGGLVKKMIDVMCGIRNVDDRDNIGKKRFETAGVLVAALFRSLYKRLVRSVTPAVQKRMDIEVALSRLNTITSGMRTCFGTGKWGIQKNSYVRQGVSQVLVRLTHGASISHKRRIVIPVGKEGKNSEIRQLHGSQIFFICLYETPEGHASGINKNLSLCCEVTNGTPSSLVSEKIEQLENFIPCGSIRDWKNVSSLTRIYIDGLLLGLINEPLDACEQLRALREKGLIDYSVSISYDDVDDEIHVACEAGRLIRPILSLKNGQLLPLKNTNWDSLIESARIVYRDASELENCVIAMDESSLTEGTHSHDYMEIHPCLMMGVCASNIPWPDHSQSPRNCYQCIDSTSLISMADGSQKIFKDIKVGDFIKTFDPDTYTISNTSVIAKKMGPTTKPMYEMILKNLFSIKSTFDHRFITKNGWVPMENLRPGMSVGIYGGGNRCKFEIINNIYSVQNVTIADLTTESENHSFFANNFGVHNSAMSKQALGVWALSGSVRTDTIVHTMPCSQKPLTSTKLAKMLGYDDLPCGTNCMVAIACYGGFNQEDSVIMNKGSIDRGLFRVMSFRTVSHIEKKRGTSCIEEFCAPPLDSRKRFYNYNTIGKDGFPKVGCEIQKNDVLIGRAISMKDKATGQTKIKDCSIAARASDSGVIDSVYIGTTPEGFKFVKVKIRKTRIPEEGDKCASRSAQKGTIGAILPQEDMPFTENGISPDIIINPHCLVGNTVITTNTGPQRIDTCFNKNVSVKTVDPQTLKSNNTETFDGFEIYAPKLIKVKTISGREVVCTPDHQWLVNRLGKRIWVKTCDLITNVDRITTIHSPSRIFSDAGVFPKTLTPFLKTVDHMKIYARLLGYFQMRGAVQHNQIVLVVDHMEDVKNIVEDCVSLQCTYIPRLQELYGCFAVTLCPYISSLIRKGLLDETGNVKYQKFPKWMHHAPLSVVQQFLSGHVGANGFYLSDYNKFYLFCQVDTQIGLDHLEEIQKLYQKINIDARIIDYENNYLLYTSNLYTFVTTLAWSYNIESYRASRLSIELIIAKKNGIILKKNYFEKRCSPDFDVPVHSITSLDKGGIVYDFTTRSKNHCFIANGLVSHNCIPSRMTINQLIESLANWGVIATGQRADATAFSNGSTNIVPSLRKQLIGLGLNPNGTKKLINGYNGKMIQAEIFMGPTYYQKLKHMVADKMHARAHGDLQVLTRQPLEGRARDGGMRAGEMERDCLIGHGASSFLKEKLLDLSDYFEVDVCKDCNKISNSKGCRFCGSDDIVPVQIPYACKLLFHELMTLGLRIDITPD